MKSLPVSASSYGELVASPKSWLITAAIERIDPDGAIHLDVGTSEPQPAAIAVPWGAPGPALAVGDPVLVLVSRDRDDGLVIVAAIHERLGTPAATVVLEAREALTLRCGNASIELNERGDVTIRGETVDTEAEGVQRIKGAQVRIN